MRFIDNGQYDAKGKLILKDGEILDGFSFGAHTDISGEVVFNTGMVGYPEALTDPSYSGQILVLTTPMVGNYGVPNNDKDEYNLSHYFEGEKIYISGLIITDYTDHPSHWNCIKTLGNWLKENNIPALCGIDTRKLTKKIRDNGATLGIVMTNQEKIINLNNKLKNNEDFLEELNFTDPNDRHLVQEVSTKAIKVMGEGNSPRILAFDCGMKYNISRYFVNVLKVSFTIVPYDYDLANNPSGIEYDGVFISNGPGDPTKCHQTIDSIKWLLKQEKENPNKKKIPIFGICLGNQILALACGAKTYKMKYGNRGMNQPCVDLRTTKCYITSQNHGFAVDNDSLPEDWKPLFLNANDLSNEGIIHSYLPYFSVQFHPEACGGPFDSTYLFHDFINMVNGKQSPRILVSPSLYDRKIIKKVLLVGSGGLSIGQAGEFDYSGSQAIKALKEEGIEVVLINPNIATVQTSKNLGRASPDKVYFLPIRATVIEEIIEKERPDGILISMGGQTALNAGIELWEKGVLKKYNCRVLGTPIETIIATEDREIFSQKLQQINEKLARSYSATTIEEAKEVSNKIGYPVLVRAAFALGGLGSGFADNEEQLVELAEKAFAVSDQILIDQDLRGWKEIEYEVVRDCCDNCITVCNMENFDPLGVHTGDSIVIAPSQTLTNSEYYKLRATSIKVIRSLGIIGECNIQYALNPQNEEYCIVEVNARLSRSSALASKATGYPLAYVATKLCLGKDLVSIKNSINNSTSACFEPSLDYCVVKVPRWDLSKFEKVSTKLGSSMSSVGEVMSIGKTFEEAIQKAVRMVNGGKYLGLEGTNLILDNKKTKEEILDEIEDLIRIPNDKRLYAVQYALENGYSVDKIHDLTKIDKWFLYRLLKIATMRDEVIKSGCLGNLNSENIRALKISGFSDAQIAKYTKSNEFDVREYRKRLRIFPYAKQIDTLAGEFPAQTNYLYLTYNGSEHDIDRDSIKVSTSNAIVKEGEGLGEGDGGVMVLGCGAYCIGSSVEFDWCAVSAVRQVRSMGIKAIVVNYNPETVSTDYDESDELYFEELTCERILDIYELEKSRGIIVSVGGQIPNNLANILDSRGAKILGTSPRSIDMAEDRHKFSKLLDALKIDQPEWSELKTIDEAKDFASKVGYPVIVRPSFVLSGAAMSIASNPEELINCLESAENVSPDKPVVISKYIENAKEIEFDGVSKDGILLNYAISEHVENAGVHSGDATLLLPAQKLYVQTVRMVKSLASKISAALKISGPFNIQFLAKENMVKVIECNLRASRTFPFISKTFNCNFITLSTRVMLNYPCKPYDINLYDYDYVGVKAPMFSFTRLRGADPTLGVEMSSTGEVACFGHDVQEAFLQALLASNFKIPKVEEEDLIEVVNSDGTKSFIKNQKYILISIAREEFLSEFYESICTLAKMGYKLAATPGTAEYFIRRSEGALNIKILSKKNDDDSSLNTTDSNEIEIENDKVLDYIRQKKISLLINVSDGGAKKEVSFGYLMRRAAVDFGTSILTNLKCATLFVEALSRCKKLPCKSSEEYIGD